MQPATLFLLFISIHSVFCFYKFVPQFTDNLAGYGASSRAVRLTRDSDRFIPAICLMPCIQSDCRKKESRWKYDVGKGGCRKFKGCVGSGNNFPSEDSCEDLCENQEDPCKDVKCKRCEICDGGRCFWDDGLCPPRTPQCGPATCGGPCHFCQRNSCRRRSKCITIGRTEPPPLPPRADPCEFVRCPGSCNTCLLGQCVRIPSCAPPRRRCRTRCSDRCERCLSNRCTKIRSDACSPRHNFGRRW